MQSVCSLLMSNTTTKNSHINNITFFINNVFNRCGSGSCS